MIQKSNTEWGSGKGHPAVNGKHISHRSELRNHRMAPSCHSRGCRKITAQVSTLFCRGGRTSAHSPVHDPAHTLRCKQLRCPGDNPRSCVMPAMGTPGPQAKQRVCSREPAPLGVRMHSPRLRQGNAPKGDGMAMKDHLRSAKQCRPTLPQMCARPSPALGITMAYPCFQIPVQDPLVMQMLEGQTQLHEPVHDLILLKWAVDLRTRVAYCALRTDLP